MRPIRSAFAVAMICLWSAGALAGDSDGEPNSETYELNVSDMLGKTVFMHAWDTIRFLNQDSTGTTATFSNNGMPLAESPENMTPTRARGTYWDGVDVVNSGLIEPGGDYWMVVIESGAYEFYDIFRPESRGVLVVVPGYEHISAPGIPLDKADITADPLMLKLSETYR